jgi:hypothetical protein
VHAAQAGRLRRPAEQGGEVGEADDELGITLEAGGIQAGQDAHDPVAAARADHAAHVGIVEGLLQLGGPPLVGAGEEALAVEHGLVEDDLVATAQQLQADQEALARHGAGAGHHGDGVAGAQPRRQDGGGETGAAHQRLLLLLRGFLPGA